MGDEGGDNGAPFNPTDHLRLLVELLRPAGPELSRRIVAALLLTPEHERAALVARVEREAVDLRARADAADGARSMVVAHPPVQREGYVERVEVEYRVNAPAPSAPAAGAAGAKAKGAAASRRGARAG